MNQLLKDQTLIAELGGPAKVAELLGFDKNGGVQRVQNWTTRGIPSAIKIEFPQIFLRSREADKAGAA